MTTRGWTLALLWALAAGCGGPGAEAEGSTPTAIAEGSEPGCPAQAPAPTPLPGVTEAHRSLAYWLERQAEHGDLDEPLLSASEIADHRRGLSADPDGSPLTSKELDVAPPPDVVLREVDERLAFLNREVTEGRLVDEGGDPLTAEEAAAFRPVEEIPRPTRAIRVLLAPAPLRCGPREAGLYRAPVDPDFDRNNCSTVRAQEPVQILGRFENGMWLVRTRYAMGWLPRGASLSPPLLGDATERFLEGPRLMTMEELHVEALEAPLPPGTFLPAAGGGGAEIALVATANGLFETPLPASGFIPAQRPLTRRALLTEAFRHLGAPYGWGGEGGGRDCSRFVLDVFAAFGLDLPRHSSRQAQSGTFSIDVSDLERPADKRLVMDEAAKAGVVLLHFPGHIMIYLGDDEAGQPMAIHAFSEYLEPCPEGNGGEIVRRVDRVEVTDLTLGAGSSRKSFLERLTEVVVFGRPAGPSLRGAARFRPSVAPSPGEDASCEDSAENWIVTSPRIPRAGERMRVVVASTNDPEPAALRIVDESGEELPFSTTQLGGPPFGYVATLDDPPAGKITAVLADGSRQVACERIRVHPAGRAGGAREPGDPAWQNVWKWERDTENLYALFVEHLFRNAEGGTRTFEDLGVVIGDEDRNLLYDHLGLDEDRRLRLEPDCADLPYFLRAYFAWKLRLPFAFRRCSRGRAGRPPSCSDEPTTNLEPIDADEEVAAFQQFLRLVANSVHSGSARTVPETDRSDLYPLPLRRETLPPGTVFADPYGHLLVIAGWAPQRPGHFGAMIGADAQPDGTVGQRTFWRGSFLFHPDTEEVGAGFKAWRPVRPDRGGEGLAILDNPQIRRGGGVHPYSLEQYERSADDFYARMEELINPMPLSAESVLESLVSALNEAVERRVVSIRNGEEWVSAHPQRTMEMPTGYDIFETSGPWEDFATPARDMRLLISLDAVVGFPDAVEARPSRYGIPEAEVDRATQDLEALLRELLEAHSIEYRRSDGSMQELTLAKIVDRAERFEMAYNPNDCIEIRWGAAEGDADYASCERHAPPHQRARMRSYRDWFRARRRPPR